MNSDKKVALSIISLIFAFYLGFSLFINLPVIDQGFLFADQAVYYAMTQSMAHDLDIEYLKKDLARYYKDFGAGPQGIFLKRVKTEHGDKLFYAKSFVYSLFAAPFVRVFGYNGCYVFHSLLLLLMLFMGYSYLSLGNKPFLSLISILTFVFASIAAVYFVWITPDFFNMALVFLILFLWLYKIKYQEVGIGEERKSRLQAFLLSGGTDYLASFLAGVAVFSKPPNIILIGPIVLWNLIKKKFLKSLGLILAFLVGVTLFFGTNYILTSDWNYQGGDRKTFYDDFPLQKEQFTFDNLGGSMTSEGYFGKFLLPIKFIFYNIFYYFFGRFTGITWYFFPAMLALILFFLAKRRLCQWLILAALAGGILIYIVLMPDNYTGGGGTLANRYFLNIYPFFFFLPGLKKTRKEIGLSWIVAAVFIAQILLSPFRSSAFPATHAKKFPFKLLPVEMTMVNNFPTNTNPLAFRVNIWPSSKDQEEFLHFLDDNFHPRLEPTGIWTRGSAACEMILKTYYPLKEIVVHLLNNPRMNNEIKVKVEGKTQKITLQSKQWGELRFPVGNGFQMEERYHYRLKIKASKGSIPYFENELSDERRFIGVFFELELIPRQ